MQWQQLNGIKGSTLDPEQFQQRLQALGEFKPKWKGLQGETVFHSRTGQNNCPFCASSKPIEIELKYQGQKAYWRWRCMGCKEIWRKK